MRIVCLGKCKFIFIHMLSLPHICVANGRAEQAVHSSSLGLRRPSSGGSDRQDWTPLQSFSFNKQMERKRNELYLFPPMTEDSAYPLDGLFVS